GQSASVPRRPADSALQALKAAKLPLTHTFIRYFGDAFLEALQAELSVAKFMSGFETSMASHRCGHHEVALQFGNARTHLPGVLLTQRLDPSTPAHKSSCQHPISHAKLCHRDSNFRQAETP
ncbi:hypothetical protein, partial [Mesorhizobium amorphae]|uniref:hypothetical protein n=1 Tax=Mesorhizobium amorphae TaxID=71433 RepID=UPI0024E056B1